MQKNLKNFLKKTCILQKVCYIMYCWLTKTLKTGGSFMMIAFRPCEQNSNTCDTADSAAKAEPE